MTNNKKKSSPQKMKKRKEPIWLWLGVAGIILAGVFAYFHYTPPASLEERPSAQTVQRGQELYAQNCAVCHGPTAGGENPNSPGGGIKPEGGQSAPALNGTGHAWHHPNVMLFNKIKYGSEDKTSAMQGFKDPKINNRRNFTLKEG